MEIENQLIEVFAKYLFYSKRYACWSKYTRQNIVQHFNICINYKIYILQLDIYLNWKCSAAHIKLSVVLVLMLDVTATRDMVFIQVK